MNILLILAIFWPALAGLVIFLMPSCKDNRQLRGRAVNAALAVELALTLIMCLGQGTNMVLLNMTPTLRIEMNVDMVGCIFAVLMSAMWLLSSVFAREYMGHDNNERLYQVFFMCVLSALIGQCYAGSMVTLYVFYELMTLLSVPMVVHERTPQAVAAGIKYLVYSIFGAMMGLLGIFFFSNYLGTVTFVPGGVETAASAPSGLLLITFLVIIGFGTKAGMFPMHGWLADGAPGCARSGFRRALRRDYQGGRAGRAARDLLSGRRGCAARHVGAEGLHDPDAHHRIHGLDAGLPRAADQKAPGVFYRFPGELCALRSGLHGADRV